MATEVSNESAEKDPKGFDLSNLGSGAWIGICAAALVIGLLVGHFALGGSSAVGGNGQALTTTTVSEDQLDTVVASYTHGDSSGSLTVRDVIAQTSSLEQAKDDEGNYAVPSADSVLYAVRNIIAIDDAKSRGISATDEDLLDYAEKDLGLTPDFESIATSNNLDVDAVKDLLTNSYLLHKLQEEVGGEMTATEPEYPSEPEYATTKKVVNEETGEETDEQLSDEEIQENQQKAYDNRVPEYAEYIIGLAGDEWDAKKGTWASEDGPYATALADYEIDGDGASYNAAYAAYQVAYSAYSEAQTDYYNGITEYMSELYNNSSVSIYTLKQ